MKTYIQPNIQLFDIETNIYCGSKPNSHWTYDEDGNLVNPGGKTPPGHNKNHAAEYRNNLWED